MNNEVQENNGVAPERTKVCRDCLMEFPISNFYKAGPRLQPACKKCYNKSKHLKVKMRCQTDPIFKAAIAQEKKEYRRRIRHTESFKAASRRRRINQRIKAKKIRDEWFRINNKCRNCDSTDRLEIDHVEPHRLGRKWKNSKIWMWSEKKRTEHLKTCQPLCWTCHRLKSGFENRKFEHGLNLYERHGCKCRICKDAHAAKRRENRARKRLKMGSLSEAGLL